MWMDLWLSFGSALTCGSCVCFRLGLLSALWVLLLGGLLSSRYFMGSYRMRSICIGCVSENVPRLVNSNLHGLHSWECCLLAAFSALFGMTKKGESGEVPRPPEGENFVMLAQFRGAANRAPSSMLARTRLCIHRCLLGLFFAFADACPDSRRFRRC